MPHGTHNSSLCISPTEHTKTVYCKPNSNNIQFLQKKTQDAAFSDAAALRDATIGDARFTDAGWIQGCYICFSLPELTSKEPDCKYTSGSLKIGFHQRIGV